MKKLFMLTVLMLIAVFAFATGSTDEGAGSDISEPVTLTWYFVGSYPQPDQGRVYEEFNRRLMEKINTEIDFKPIGWGDYDQKMQVIIASGEEFDLAFTANWINNYHQNVAKGAFLPLDDLLDEYAPHLKSSVPQKIWDATKVVGEIYGIINYQVSTMTASIAFPTSLVEKYGLDVDSVDSLEDIEPYLEAVKNGEPGVVPLGVANLPETVIGYVNASLGFEEIGGRAVPGVLLNNNPNLRVVNQFATREFKDWVALMRDWNLKGYFPNDAIAITDLSPNFNGGTVGAGFEGNYAPGAEISASDRYGYPVSIAPISEPLLITSGIIASMQGISSTSQNPERAMMFMELLNTDKELYNLLCYGIEGVHYEKLDGDFIQPIADSGYAPNTNWEFASVFNAYKLEGMPETVWEETRDLNMNAVASPLIGFAFDPTPVQSEIAQCTSVRQEYLPALELGYSDPDELLPEFLEKLEIAGAQKIIDEMQSQIDAWKATR